MSVETAAVAVGKAVGKHVVLAWLTDRSAEQERNKDLVDLVQARFPDRIMRRRFERQVADIADQVAGRLLTLCGHEYGGLRKNDKAAVLAEVVRTLTGADFSDQALFAADVDAARLAAHVRAGIPGRRMESELGEAAARLYDIVLDECCDCLVRIIKQLPQFGPRASAETLARLSGVADQVSLVLARLPVRTLDAPGGTASDESFRRRYLEHVSVALDTLELFGVRVERYRPRTTLSVAYISLSVSTGADSVASMRSRRPSVSRYALHRDEWRQDEQETKEATLRVETALGQGRLTLIRGEAGSGKSTLLRWLAICAARGMFTADLAGWNGCVPFLIKLRSHSGQPLPPPERFLQGVADPIAGLMPAGWVHRQLRSGRVLLLVDGVDELPSAQRRAVRAWLSGILSEYPQARAVVTSRPAAAGAEWLAAEGFTSAFLERMTPADLTELIRHWHDAVRDAGDLPCTAEELPGFEAALLARMESAPHLRALAGSPLLAAMLCALNLDREKQLPRDRMGLYAAALDLLLERRDVERQIQADDGAAIGRSQKMQVLQDLAWRLSITGRAELPKTAVIRWTGDKLATMPGAPPDAAAAFEHLLQRSGILREPASGRIDFVHRTVQEYLAAKQFTEDGDLEPLIAQAHKDQWRETIIMAAGHANAPQRAELLSGLLSRIGGEPRRARQLSLLVAGCLETLPAIPAELRRDVEACAAMLLPPRSLAAARSLSNVGQPILDRLPATGDGLTAAQARAVVRTAWLINGPEALELLAGYATDPRPEVQEELVKGWEYFDAEIYAQRVLASAPLDDGHLNVPQVRMLRAARHLSQLRSITSSSSDVVPDLTFLRAFRQPLRRLFIGPVQSGDLSPLGTCEASLEDLFIGPGAVIHDVSPITRLPQLQQLALSGAGRSDIEFVRHLPQLQNLQLSELNDVTDLSPLKTQVSLTWLEVDDCPALGDIDDLPPLGKLRNLSVAGSALPPVAQVIAKRAPELRTLSVTRSSAADDLAPLSALPLQALILWGCTGIADFTPLEGMSDLDFLDLEDTAIGSLAPLSRLSELETLWLRNCRNVADLAPLAALKKLRRVWIAGIAPGVDLAPLASSRATVYIAAGQQVRNRQALGRRLQEG